jgi:fatty acid/phospholipid biosynthesis enzyme
VRHAGNAAIAAFRGRITLGDGAGVVRDALKGVVDHGHKTILLDPGATIGYRSSGRNPVFLAIRARSPGPTSSLS